MSHHHLEPGISAPADVTEARSFDYMRNRGFYQAFPWFDRTVLLHVKSIPRKETLDYNLKDNYIDDAKPNTTGRPSNTFANDIEDVFRKIGALPPPERERIGEREPTTFVGVAPNGYVRDSRWDFALMAKFVSGVAIGGLSIAAVATDVFGAELGGVLSIPEDAPIRVRWPKEDPLWGRQPHPYNPDEEPIEVPGDGELDPWSLDLEEEPQPPVAPPRGWLEQPLEEEPQPRGAAAEEGGPLLGKQQQPPQPASVQPSDNQPIGVSQPSQSSQSEPVTPGPSNDAPARDVRTVPLTTDPRAAPKAPVSRTPGSTKKSLSGAFSDVVPEVDDVDETAIEFQRQWSSGRYVFGWDKNGRGSFRFGAGEPDGRGGQTIGLFTGWVPEGFRKGRHWARWVQRQGANLPAWAGKWLQDHPVQGGSFLETGEEVSEASEATKRPPPHGNWKRKRQPRRPPNSRGRRLPSKKAARERGKRRAREERERRARAQQRRRDENKMVIKGPAGRAGDTTKNAAERYLSTIFGLPYNPDVNPDAGGDEGIVDAVIDMVSPSEGKRPPPHGNWKRKRPHRPNPRGRSRPSKKAARERGKRRAREERERRARAQQRMRDENKMVIKGPAGRAGDTTKNAAERYLSTIFGLPYNPDVNPDAGGDEGIVDAVIDMVSPSEGKRPPPHGNWKRKRPHRPNPRGRSRPSKKAARERAKRRAGKP